MKFQTKMKKITNLKVKFPSIPCVSALDQINGFVSIKLQTPQETMITNSPQTHTKLPGIYIQVSLHIHTVLKFSKLAKNTP